MIYLLYYVAWFFGAVFFVNAIPHFVSGLMGRPFPTPFAKPPGRGLSSSVVNVVWGSFNFLIAYVLLCHVGALDLRLPVPALIVGCGGFLMAVFTAHLFGKINGGQAPKEW